MRVATLRSTARAAGVRFDFAKRNSTSLLSESVEWCGVSVSIPVGFPTVATSLDVDRVRPLVVALVFCFVPFLRWFTTRYVLTNQRLILRSGFALTLRHRFNDDGKIYRITALRETDARRFVEIDAEWRID